MNGPSFDEYEEVESPFAPKSSGPKPQRDRLRSRKNVFNRPFGAASTSAPLVLETTSRKSLSVHEDIEDVLEKRKTNLSSAEIEYLDEEEEVVERSPVVRGPSAPKKSAKSKKNILPKVGWFLVGILVLRLICMDRGVWDYFSTEGDIKEKQDELSSIRTENKGLRSEITRIQTDRNHQRQLAKEHLGVIAADEFLILFAGEVPEESNENIRL